MGRLFDEGRPERHRKRFFEIGGLSEEAEPLVSLPFVQIDRSLELEPQDVEALGVHRLPLFMQLLLHRLARVVEEAERGTGVGRPPADGGK